MRNIVVFLIALMTVTSSCKEKNDLESKREELQAYKDEVKELNTKIKSLEKDIAELDSTKIEDSGAKAVLVSTKEVQPAGFKHKIEVRGSVESKRNVMLTSETAGKIEDIRVNEGQNVRAGQTLIVLDADIIKNNIAELKTSLELASAVYKRQSNLWEKKIGTEIQYLEAKNKKESLERQLATANSQLDQAIIKAPFTGIVDAIPAREGEMAQPGKDLIRLVSPEKMYIDADVSERYISDFKKNDEVELYFPVQDRHVTSKVSSVGGVVKSDNRTFSIEVKLPKLDFDVKPNQVVVLRLVDYESDDALVVPTEVILSDSDGKFLYTATKKNGTMIAKKQKVETGSTYGGMTEIVDGLAKSDIVVTEGYRSLSDGVTIKSVDQGSKTAKL